MVRLTFLAPLLACGLSLMGPLTSARAGLLPVGVSVTPEAGKFRWTYAIVLALHAASTFAAFPRYLDPWKHLLFFAAWPMLAACIALYLMRDEDTLFALDQHRPAT